MRKFKKCLITGITGSGGSFMAETVLQNDSKIKVYGFYRSPGYKNYLKKKFKNRIILIKLDLNNFNICKNQIKKIKPDLIFHLASNADVRGSFDEPKKIIENNNQITLNILESIRLSKINPIFIMCSTSEVYGKVRKREVPITEQQIMRPASPYAVSKSFQDLLAQVYFSAYGLNIIITRMFTYTNPRRDNLFQSAFAKQVALIEKNKKKFLTHGNLKSIRTFLDYKDAFEAYWIVAKKGKIGEIYNLGGNTVLSVKKVLDLLKKMSKKKIISKVDKKLLRPNDVTLQIPSTIKFFTHTKWKPKININQSLKNTLDYYRRLAKS